MRRRAREVLMNQCIEVPADHQGVLRLIAFADEVERTATLSFDQHYLMRLVIEEIATNIVKYGYEQGQDGVIQFRYTHDASVLRMVICDRGRPFDPREHPDPDLHDDLATREIGGLGLFLVREAADAITYHHDS